MRKLLLALSTCLTLAAYGQTAPKQTNILTTKTSKHINIPGTRLFIIPPSGFVTAKSCEGTTVSTKDENTGINFTDTEGANFYMDPTLDKKTFERNGIPILDYQELKLNNFSAKYIELAPPGKHLVGLLFGDNTFSTFVLGMSLSTDSKSLEEIKQAFRTIYYDKDFKTEPSIDLPFTIDDSKSPLKFAQTMAEVIVYSEGGKPIDENTDLPFMLFTPISNTTESEKTSLESIAQMLIDKLESDPSMNTKVANMSNKIINDQPAYEVEIYTKSGDLTKMISQIIILKNDEMLMIQGVASNNFETNLKTFKSLVQTIKLK